MTADQATLLKRAIIQGVSERYECELAQSKVDVTCSQDHLQKISQVLGFDVQKLQKAKKRKIIAAALVLAAALAIGLWRYSYEKECCKLYHVEFIILGSLKFSILLLLDRICSRTLYTHLAFIRESLKLSKTIRKTTVGRCSTSPDIFSFS